MDTNEINEAAIKEALKRSDREALGLMFRLYYPRLLGYACKFVTKEAAEDIVQDVFIQLQHKGAAGDIRQTLQGYLFRSVHNSCVDHLRHQMVHRRYVDATLTALSLEEAAWYDPEKGRQSLVLAAGDEQVQEAIGQLPPKCRAILELRYKDGLRTREISGIMGISARTVETQLYKAMKQLRSNIKKIKILIWSLY
ncbi:RNA polymerase sigma-70 factor [Chitinophaga sp.]|uniref:RNA polymerase sigma factor n=1 Tax=Chitinophaga sp. TaxID=1869181 RepID=UPI002CC4437A|nr:RNA polymerase sigma-70 factor [Chitinophaga sp.]HWV64738.1 RNA polymerase sigma-70 factor [Chitinophaga sp.]